MDVTREWIWLKLAVGIKKKADRKKDKWATKYKTDYNKIIFLTWQNRYTCNPKYICEEILRRGLPWELVWMKARRKDLDHREGVRFVQFFTRRYFKEIYTARVFIDNGASLFKTEVKLKDDQIFIETLHGSLGIKKMGNEADTNPDRMKRWACATANTDICISNSDFEDGIFRRTYWPDARIWKYGHARNDIFFWSKDRLQKVRDKVRTEIPAIGPDTKIILYAPTFRDYAVSFHLDAEELIKACRQKFGGEDWLILERAHNADSLDEYLINRDHVVDANSYCDIQELMAITDVGITDYSSWIFDYVLFRRPGFLYTPDLELYDGDRGFEYPLRETPFPIGKDLEEIREAILAYDQTEYEKKVDAFLKGKGCIDDGHAAERIVDELEKLMKQDS